jgi:hypothetical protein
MRKGISAHATASIVPAVGLRGCRRGHRVRATAARAWVAIRRAEGGEDRVADKLGDLRDYGVSEGLKSVHPSGNPMSHSTHRGFKVPSPELRTSGWLPSIFCIFEPGRPAASSFAVGVGHIFTATARGIPPCAYGFERFDALSAVGAGQSLAIIDKSMFRPRFSSRSEPSAVRLPFSPSDALGVGNNPNPVASVRGTNGESWYAMPVRIIPERGQVSENRVQPSRKQRSDVLHDEDLGSKFANEADDFGPEPRTLASKACTRSGQTDVLAGEPAADDIDGNSIGSKSLCGKLPHVPIAGDIGPVLGEDAAGEVFDFAERDRLETACAFEAKAEPSNTREQIKDAQHLRSPQRMPVIIDRHRPRTPSIMPLVVAPDRRLGGLVDDDPKLAHPSNPPQLEQQNGSERRDREKVGEEAGHAASAWGSGR